MDFFGQVLIDVNQGISVRDITKIPITYYRNSIAAQRLFILAGDIPVNPGPTQMATLIKLTAIKTKNNLQAKHY